MSLRSRIRAFRTLTHTHVSADGPCDGCTSVRRRTERVTDFEVGSPIKETVVHDDTVTWSWKGLTDKVKGTLTADHRQTTRGVASERHPAAPATAPPRAGATRLAEAAASPSTVAHAQTAAASRSANRDVKVVRKVAPLATWEDEGGATASVE
jgi:hypothetical protein